jgi:hypothetical protein
VAAPQHDGYPGMSWSLGLPGLQEFGCLDFDGL